MSSVLTITEVYPDSEAIRVDLRTGDELLKYNGVSLNGDLELFLGLLSKSSGETDVELAIKRESSKKTILVAGGPLGIFVKPKDDVASVNRVSTSSDVLAMMSRYQDAYKVARITIKTGQILKGIAIVLGIGTALFSMFLSSSMNSVLGTGGLSDGAAIQGVIVGLITWFFTYIWAVLINNRGQTTLATLDDAVNSCKLFEDVHRAKIFRLPSAKNTK